MISRLFCIVIGVVWLLSIVADFTSRIFSVVTDGVMVALMIAFALHAMRQTKS